MTKARLLPLIAAIACALILPASAQAVKPDRFHLGGAFTPNVKSGKWAVAVFAGGCFWTVEHKFEEMPGVVDAISGYAGGKIPYPIYEEVIEGLTGHMESVEVVYDPTVVSYRTLVDHFWRMIDPTDADGQVCDLGENYHTAIFVDGRDQRKAVMDSMAAINDGPRKGKIATKVLGPLPFYPAEDEYQDYAKNNPEAYAKYVYSCGRERRLAVIWADKPKLG